jgi:hypothetical protein
VNNNGNIGCLIPPKTMTYAYNGLTIINAYGYACDDGVNSVRKIVVIVDSTSGMAPFRFDLYSQTGTLVSSNTTGIFYNAGEPNETVRVTVSDHCNSSYNQYVKITNLEKGAGVVFANNDHVCLNDNIYLHGIAIAGAQMSYEWEGPNNFHSQNKDPIIYNANLEQQGYYELSILGLECAIKDDIFITILPPDTAFIEDFTCPDQPYTGYGFDIPPLFTPDTTYIFINSNLHTAQYQCDSTAYLLLKVQDYASLSIDSVSEICADDPFFILPYNTYGEKSYYYNIQFNSNAQQQGFANIDSGKTIYDNYIEINIPQGIDKQDYVLPHNHYAASIYVDNGNCKSRELEFSFPISYPNWITEQKWNDVIALLNDRYNGGYTFSKYEWYKNGKKLEGENKSYIYILPTLDFGAEYRALVTRTLDGEAVFTCPLIPQYRANVKVYPQLVSQNEPIYIETQENGHVVVWNTLGQKIAAYPVFEQQINKVSMDKTGLFLLEVVSNNGVKQTFKIIVQ